MSVLMPKKVKICYNFGVVRSKRVKILVFKVKICQFFGKKVKIS